MEQLNYAKQLMVQLNQQRSRGYLCDVIIVVESALFRAHKNVLSASSSYFKSLLLHDNLLNLDTEIISPSVFKQVLDFIYTGSVASPDHVSDQGVADLLTAASYLQVSHLAAFCHRRLRPSSSGRTPSSSSTDLLHAPNGHLSLGPYPFSHLRANHHHGHHARAVERRVAAQEGHHQSRDTTQGEGFGSRWASRHSFAAGHMMDSSVEVFRDLGLDLTRKSPTGSGTATEEVSSLNGVVGPPRPPASNTPTNTTGSASPDRRRRENSGQRYDPLRSRAAGAERQQRAAHRRRPGAGGAGGENTLQRALLNGHGRSPEEEEAGDDMIHGEDDGASLEERAGDLGPAQEEEVSTNQTEPCGDINSIQKESEEEVGATTCSYNRFPPGGDDDDEPPVGDNLYVCIPCGRGFSSSEQLNAHVESHTAEELCINVKVEGEEDTTASQPPCDIWRQAGGPADSRSVNTSVKDEGEDEAADPTKNQPEDPPKEETAAEVRSHPHHLLLHHHHHACSVCNQRCEDASSLRQHERSHHWLANGATTRASFPCTLCGKLFTQRGTMTRHMRSHLGLKPFACHECGMRFTRQYRLTEHARVHSGEKPYACQLCGGKFTQQRNLISHLRMHTLAS